MATNRPDTLDPALLRPGRLDRKIEIPLPNEQGRLEILKIHASSVTKHGEIDYEAIVKLSEGFNGADLRNICTEAGKMTNNIIYHPHKLTIFIIIASIETNRYVCNS